MTTTRTHRRPAKFEECITGDDLDEVVNSDEESVTVHRQCDGKINNITFKIEAENIDTWKPGIVTFFGESRTTLLNSNRVVKINYDTKNWVKFNFFDTGSVNMVPDLETELKTVHELTNNTVISQSSESTPMKKSGNAPKRQMTPKENNKSP